MFKSLLYFLKQALIILKTNNTNNNTRNVLFTFIVTKTINLKVILYFTSKSFIHIFQKFTSPKYVNKINKLLYILNNNELC